MLNKKVYKLSDDATHALNYVLHLLTRREYSEFELKQKLKTRYIQAIISSVIDKAKENNWQSDDRYADMLVRHYVSSLYGPLKIFMEAKRKGVSKDLILQYLDDVNFDDVAYQNLLHKYNNLVLDKENQVKALQYLQRRGFYPKSCFYALKKFMQKDSDID